MKKIFKDLVFEIKKQGEHTIQAVVSTEQVDRDGDTLRAEGWDLTNFKKNPQILWAHRYSSPPVGKALDVWVENSKLLMKIKFPGPEVVGENSFEHKIEKLYMAGYLKAFSVGFDPTKHEVVDRDGRRGIDFIEMELLEVSAVPLPANPDALIQATAKGLIGPDDLRMMQAQSSEGAVVHPLEVVNARLKLIDKLIQERIDYRLGRVDRSKLEFKPSENRA